MKLKEEELSSLTAKHLELGKDHSRVSSELAEVHQQAEDGFKRITAASVDVATRVLQLDRHAELSGLAPDCRSLPEVTEFLRKTTASVRSAKNRIALRLRTDRNGANLDTAARVMASFREANLNAVMPNFVVDKPSEASLQPVKDLAATLATKMCPLPPN